MKIEKRVRMTFSRADVYAALARHYNLPSPKNGAVASVSVRPDNGRTVYAIVDTGSIEIEYESEE